MKNISLVILSSCIVNGEHADAGTVVSVSPQEAYGLIFSGRALDASTDEGKKVLEEIKAAKPAKKAEKA